MALKVINHIILTCVFVLIVVLALLCVPVLNIPMPRTIRQNSVLQHFFAWDCAETFEINFNDSALRDYLAFQRK
jgi:hypothetical protein